MFLMLLNKMLMIIFLIKKIVRRAENADDVEKVIAQFELDKDVVKNLKLKLMGVYKFKILIGRKVLNICIRTIYKN